MKKQSLIELENSLNQYVTNEDGDLLFTLIDNEFKKDNKVVISMLGIHGLNTSFVNSAFIQLLEHYSYEFIKRNLIFTNSNKQINDVILNNFKYQTERGKFQ